MTKIKICGITNLEDALSAVRLKVDALGFNFYKKSSRYIEPAAARLIIQELPLGIDRYGVFVNEEAAEIASIAKLCSLDVIQLHGDETPEYITELKSKIRQHVIKVFRLKNEADIETIKKYKPDYCFVDTFQEKLYGGTGISISIDLLQKAKSACKNIIVAGGLNSGNVAEVIKKVSPYAVDVASGVEERPGKKDYRKLEQFIQTVKNNT